MHWIPVFALCLLITACGRKYSEHTGVSEVQVADIQGLTRVPMHPIVFEGNRYVVNTDFGIGHPVPLMVHGNANLYLMLTHDVATELNHGNPIPKIRDYGYSARGMGKIVLDTFRIGEHHFKYSDSIPVFDWPEGVGKAAQGMLGLGFLKQEGVLLDFGSEQITIHHPVNAQPDSVLIRKGYQITPFNIEHGRATFDVYFPSLAKTLQIIIGTVAGAYTLDAVTFQDSIPLRASGTSEHSPNDTRPDMYENAQPISYTIAGQAFEIPESQAELHSMAEYANIEQSELLTFGIFGRDWMVVHQAVIDYANQRLYFKE